MFSKQTLKNYLREISEDAAFIRFQFSSMEKFSIQLKCKIDSDYSVEAQHQWVSDWIKKFSNFTATTWIVRNSFPKMKRLVYRKVYACHRSSFNKKKLQDSEQTRNQGCRAKLDFRIKFINRNTMKNDPHLRDGLNMAIAIEFVHSHKLRTMEAFNLLKSTSETDDLFYSYFKAGYSSTSAKLYHELMLIDQYGDKPECMMNANLNPTMRHLYYLHKKTKKTGQNTSFEEIMSEKRADLENAGGYINCDNPDVIVVVTPTMRRVISMISLDHILIDSVLTNAGSVVTLLYVPSKAGALPIACVLHAELSETNYSQALLTTKLTLENICNGQFEPKLLTLKESKDIREATNAIFPNSTILSSKWSLCAEIWQWTFADDVKIDGKKRHSVMEMFSKMVKANALDEAEVCYGHLKNDECAKWSPVIEYIDSLWERREQWLYEDGPQYMKLVEAGMRIMNEFLIRKCKTFNVNVMVDVVVNIIESQLRHILHAQPKGLDLASTHTRFLAPSKAIPDLDADLKRVNLKEFKIDGKTKPRKCIRFRVDTWCCDCSAGRTGRFCEHLCSIIHTVETDLMKTSELTDEEKCLLTEIAGGDLRETKQIKPELLEDMEVEDTDDQEEINDDDVDKQESETSPKSENDESNDGNYFYLDVKTEKYDGNDPLETILIDNEDKCEESNSPVDFDMPGTSASQVDMMPGPRGSKEDSKRKYEDAMKNLNSEFRRLNKYFKENPNKGNLETMVRLARELGKIRPVERADFSNLNIKLNKELSEADSLF